ncbi:MAG: L-lactate dehydrogenase [Promethearchaeota archaeon]
MNALHPKVAVVGAGNVGTRFAYAAAIKGVARHLVLLDLNVRRLEGDVADLSHGEPYFPHPVKVQAGSLEDLRGSDLVVVTAGRNQRPGETRMDLVRDNVRLFEDLIPRVVEAAPGVVLLVVTNPVDVLAKVAWELAGRPPGRVFGSGTVLDSARLRHALGRHCGVDPRSVHAYVLGEHGDTEFPLWSRATIGNASVREFCADCERAGDCDPDERLVATFREVRDAAYHVIDRKGETSFGVGLAMVRIAQAVINDENSVLPVSTRVPEFYGLGDVGDVFLGLPAVVNRGGVRAVLQLEMEPAEREALERSAAAIRRVLDAVGY